MVDFTGQKIDFLSKLGIWTGEKVEFSRTPHKALTSGSYTTSNVEKESLYGNKGFNLSLWTKNMPIFNEFAENFGIE